MHEQIKQLLNSQIAYLTVDKFMEYSLMADEEGYYQSALDPISRGGDFITAPEISPLFGEMIAIWVRLCWEKLAYQPCLLVELGPGNGTLMDAILHFNQKQPQFNLLKVKMVERSKKLRLRQQEKLSKYNIQVEWGDTFSDVTQSHLPIILVANEFFDALPVKQFQKTTTGWQERIIVSNNNKLSWSLMPAANRLSFLPAAEEGAIYEQMTEGSKIISEITDYLAQNRGAALIIDYGYDIPLERRRAVEYNSSLQAVSNHQYTDIFSTLGRADLSTHVDFGQLKSAAQQHNKNVSLIGPIAQSELLETLGIENRFSRLFAASDAQQRADLVSQYHRLVSRGEMGELYKALMVVNIGI